MISSLQTKKSRERGSKLCGGKMTEKKTVRKKAVSKKAKVSAPVIVSASNSGEESYFEAVKRKAYEIYEKRGKFHGMDLHDWLTAENELKPGLGN